LLPTRPHWDNHRAHQAPIPDISSDGFGEVLMCSKITLTGLCYRWTNLFDIGAGKPGIDADDKNIWLFLIASSCTGTS
jgi:hypothetical protein